MGTRKNPIFVDLETSSEVLAMGKLIDEVNFQNDHGSNVSVAYYHDGIPLFNKTLNEDKFYDLGLTFHLSSYENAFGFSLFHPEKREFIASVALWRDNLGETLVYEEKLNAPIVKVNQFLNIVKSGGLGEGMVGAGLSMVVGSGLSKFRKVKTEDFAVNLFILEYFDDKDERDGVALYCHPTQEHSLLSFLEKHWGKEISEDSVQKQDSRCFIATACYGNPYHEKVEAFRQYRDSHLKKSPLGRIFIRIYYSISPIMVKHLSKRTRRIIRIKILDKLYKKIN
ncbi:CFI-box-CTERM domain-containing protein [Salinimicrobium sp. TIG7-5_MAKvit]|uniref:CFI-box-CTERM domain-containing protein n=1 Tax=Salinimicrobium sp. TIG7-5_MAKvit TaxID=3121289 RepID=UPI003C6E8B7F